MFGLQARRSGIAFDLGAAGIRAFQFRQRRGQPSLCDALSLDRTVTDADHEPEPPLVESEQLSRLVGQGRFAGQDVALVLSAPEVQFFPMHLPDQALAQPAERIEQALKWEVAQETRRSAEDLELRFWRLPTARGQQANVMAVTMLAATAAEWCQQLEQCGLMLRRIDVSPCALVRLARQMWTPAENDLWGVLDLGLRHSTLTVVVGQVPTYIRAVSASTHRWTQLLADAFEVSYPVAEQLKREHGIAPLVQGAGAAVPAPTSPAGLSQAGDITAALGGVLRDSLRALSQEIGRCFSYVMQGFPDYGVKRLLLAGGGANLRGLPAVLEGELGIPAHALCSGTGDDSPVWERPLAGVRVNPRSAAALGAAMLDLEAAA